MSINDGINRIRNDFLTDIPFQTRVKSQTTVDDFLNVAVDEAIARGYISVGDRVAFRRALENRILTYAETGEGGAPLSVCPPVLSGPTAPPMNQARLDPSTGLPLPRDRQLRNIIDVVRGTRIEICIW